jgi:hypothetical protein
MLIGADDEEGNGRTVLHSNPIRPNGLVAQELRRESSRRAAASERSDAPANSRTERRLSRTTERHIAGRICEAPGLGIILSQGQSEI